MNPRSNKKISCAFFTSKFTEFRHSLSYIDALPQLTLLGLLVGLLTGAIIVAFRLIIDLPLTFFLPNHDEDFESLSVNFRILLIVGGSGLLIAFLCLFSPKDRAASISHVLDRVHNHQAKLPFKNWCIQFIGAAICLASGQSVGREGPVVHLGAGAASQFGQWLRLPNNSIQTLVGCGVAAAISSSFNTPMTGVIFAMEILALEYTIVGFMPVMLASVMGAVVSKAILHDTGFLTVGDTNIHSLYEIPFMVVVGVFIAICAGIYIRLNIFALKFQHHSLVRRLIVACMLTSIAVIWVPQIMGQGYDTINQAIEGKFLLSTLALIAIVKLLVTPVVIGLGVPGGLIGPLLVVGACVGGFLGFAAAHFFPELGAHPRFYVMMGMAGMMAAVLNAPLTALVTVLELSYNPNIIFPAMLVIVVACVTTRQLFKVQSIFIEQLRHSNRPLDFGPAKQALKRSGVRSVMDTRFAVTAATITPDNAQALLANHPMWLIIIDENDLYSYAMRAADLANYLTPLQASSPEPQNSTKQQRDETEQTKTNAEVNLLEISSRRFRISAIHESASLYEAMQGLKHEGSEMLYVSGVRTPYSSDIKGILSLTAIENYYKPEEFRNAVD